MLNLLHFASLLFFKTLIYIYLKIIYKNIFLLGSTFVNLNIVNLKLIIMKNLEIKPKDIKQLLEEDVLDANSTVELIKDLNIDSSILLKDRHKQRFEDYIKIFYVKTGEMYRFKWTNRMNSLSDVFKMFCERENINL